MAKTKKAPKKPVKSKAKPAKKPAVKAKAAKPAKPAKPVKPVKVAKSAKATKPVKAVPAKEKIKSSSAAKPGAKTPAAKAPIKGAKPLPKIEAKGKGPAVKPEKGGKVPAVNPVEAVEETAPEAEEVVLTDAEGRRYCRVKDCDQLSSVEGYCRYHYLLFWKKIQVRKKILSEGKLERYIEELTARYPDKFLDMLRKDLRSEKEFLAAIQELEIDESQDEGDFNDEGEEYIEEVRGISEPSTTSEDEF